jgi:hypothetical protein
MTRHELGEKLTSLDPGAHFTVEPAVLAEIFGADALSEDLTREIERFALDHRCTFSHHEHGRTVPCFEKEDRF